MRTKLFTSFVVVTSFWWAVSFILWSSGPYSSNLGALKDISSLLEGWVNLKSPVDVANSSIADSWAVQWFVLMYWTGPILLLTALSTGVGSIRVWKHAAEFKKERDIREAAETTAYRGVGCTKGKLPRIGTPLADVHQVELDGFSSEINSLVSEILSTIHAGYSDGTIFKGEEVDGDWMEYIEEKCQYVLEVAKEKELALVAALGVELGKITVYVAKKGAPGKPLKFSKGGVHKTLGAEGAKQIAKLESWWKLSPDLRAATVSVLRYLEQPEFLPDGLFKDASLKERVLTAIDDVFDIKPVQESGEAQAQVVPQKSAPVASVQTDSTKQRATTQTEKQRPQAAGKNHGTSSPAPATQKQAAQTQSNEVSSNSDAGPAAAESTYTAEQEAQIKENLAERFKSMQEQDGVKQTGTQAESSPSLDEVFGNSDFAFPPETDSAESSTSLPSNGNTPPWEDEPTDKTDNPPVEQKPAPRSDVTATENQESPAVNSGEGTVGMPGSKQPSGEKPTLENAQKKKKVVVDNTPAAGGFMMTPGAEYMLEPNSIDRHLDRAMLDLWPIMAFHSPNQPKGAQAFGWKQGKRIYLIEIKFREAVAKRIPAEVLEGLSPTSYNEKLNALSRELIAYFIRKGWLVNKIEDVVLSAREPLWKIQAGLYEFNGVFALDVSNDILEMLPTYNSKFQLSVIGCLWNHTIVTGRFPKRDADGNIVQEVEQPRHEKRQKDQKPQSHHNRPAYKDPTQMNSLPSDLLAPNSGKFKKDNSTSAIEADAKNSTKEESTKAMATSSVDEKQNASSDGDKAPVESKVADSHSNRPRNKESIPGGTAQSPGAPKTHKPSGMDLLSLVTSGSKVDKKPNASAEGMQKTNAAAKGPNPQRTKQNTSPKNDSVSSTVKATELPDDAVNKQQSATAHATQEANENAAEPKTSEVSRELTKEMSVDSPESIKPDEIVDAGSEKNQEEKIESLSIDLTDIVTQSGALETHVPDNEEAEIDESQSEEKTGRSETSLDGLDVDALIDDFASDLEKSKPKESDKP